MQGCLNTVRPGEFPEVPEGGTVWVFAVAPADFSPYSTTYGPRWLVPTQILDGRLVQFSANLSF